LLRFHEINGITWLLQFLGYSVYIRSMSLESQIMSPNCRCINAPRCFNSWGEELVPYACWHCVLCKCKCTATFSAVSLWL